MKNVVCKLSFVISFITISHNSTAQTYPQLRLKLGWFGKTFATPHISKGYAYQASSLSALYPVLGLEYSKPMKDSSQSNPGQIEIVNWNKLNIGGGIKVGIIF